MRPGGIQQRYRTASGTDIVVWQEELVGSGQSLDLAAIPLVEPIEIVGGIPMVVQEGGVGAPPIAVMLLGSSRVTISGSIPADELRKLVPALHPIDRDGWEGMIEAALEDSKSGATSEDLGSGLTLYRQEGQTPIACSDGEGSLVKRCARALSEAPLVIAVPDGSAFVVVGCLGSIKGDGHVRINGQDVPTETRECGRSFQVPLVGPKLRVELVDDQGVPFEMEFDLPDMS